MIVRKLKEGFLFITLTMGLILIILGGLKCWILGVAFVVFAIIYAIWELNDFDKKSGNIKGND